MRRIASIVLALFSGLAIGQDLPEDTNAITSLTVEQAQTLVARGYSDLELNGLTEISDEVAKVLGDTSGLLSLNGLSKLTFDAAEALARVKNLQLNGLQTLTPLVASAFEQHEGRLSLNGLRSLSPGEVRSLAMHPGPLSLMGLTTLSDEAVRALQNPKIRLPEEFSPKPIRKEPRGATARDPVTSTNKTDHPVRLLARPEEGVRHSDLDAAWTAYASSVATASDKFTGALQSQLDAAADKGALEEVEHWQAAIEAWQASRRFPTDPKEAAPATDKDDRKSVRPSMIKPVQQVTDSKVLASDVAEVKDVFTKAAEQLQGDYEALTKKLTMAKDFVTARKVKDEWTVISKTSATLGSAPEMEVDKRVWLTGTWTAGPNDTIVRIIEPHGRVRELDRKTMKEFAAGNLRKLEDGRYEVVLSHGWTVFFQPTATDSTWFQAMDPKGKLHDALLLKKEK